MLRFDRKQQNSVKQLSFKKKIIICLPLQEMQVDPWSRKMLLAAEQLSPCATVTEPVHHKRSHRNEKPVDRN